MTRPFGPFGKRYHVNAGGVGRYRSTLLVTGDSLRLWFRYYLSHESFNNKSLLPQYIKHRESYPDIYGLTERRQSAGMVYQSSILVCSL